MPKNNRERKLMVDHILTTKKVIFGVNEFCLVKEILIK
jgi:hypothetical protein